MATNYDDWDWVMRSIHERCPNLELVSSKADWEASKQNTKRASHTLVTVKNADGEEHTSPVGNLVSGLTRHLTATERSAIFSAKSVKGDMSYQHREEEAIAHLCEIVKMRHADVDVKSMDAQGAENTSADAYMVVAEKRELVGIQMTRLNFAGFAGMQRINKSSAVFLKMLGLGFAFIAAIYSNGFFCGAYLWLPNDEDAFCDEFSTIALNLFSKKIPRRGSLAERMKPYLFLWRTEDKVIERKIQNAFVDKLVTYAKKPFKTYTLEELESQLSSCKLKEKLYIESFETLLMRNTGFERVTGRKGDVKLDVLGTQALIELKLANLNYNQFQICFRFRSREPWDLNEVSVLGIVITDADTSGDNKLKKSETYKYFVLLPTRTADGTPNIRYDDPLAFSLYFRFDRDTLEFSSKKVKDKEAIVLVAGEGGRMFDEAAQKSVFCWVNRRRVDMQSIIQRWHTEKRDTEQSAKVNANKRKRL